MITPKPATVFDLFNGHPERWCKGCGAKDESGMPVSCLAESAASVCVDAAIVLVYGRENYADPYFRIKSVLVRDMVSDWNDSPSTTFDAMLAKVKEAGI